jgi:membrane-bound lytic murein transglycosylase D
MNSVAKKETHHGLSITRLGISERMSVLSILCTKRLPSALYFVLIFLVGPVGASTDDFSSECLKQNTAQPIYFHQTEDSAAGNGEYALSGADGETPSLREGRSSTEQKASMIRERLQVDEGDENDEPLIGENDLQENISIPIVFNDAVEHYIRYFTTTKKDLFKRWLKRKKRYAPLVKEILSEQGLPEDLVYLAMIESGFNLHAYSPMKAAGPWQFIPETGRRYGLVVNHWVDERRDIRKSTIAAARYLQELFDQFGCWYLAAAGYNAGENRIERLIKRYDTKDFWRLRAYNTLPRETREYVPQLIAAAVIAKDPERYGLGVIEDVLPFEFVKETIPGGVPLKAVAEAASIDVSSIRTFNPEIRRGITPPGKDYGIKLPVETDSDTFQTSLATILLERKRVVAVIRHLARRRDTMSKITSRYGVSKEDLVLVNGSPLRLKNGTLVFIPRFDTAQGKAKTADFRKKMAPRTDRNMSTTRRASTYVVKKGETLSAIAEKYGMDMGALKRANRLKTDRIEQGKRLSLAGHVRRVPQQVQKKYHRVQRGDTLSGIAEKYGKSVRTLRNMNRLKNNRIQKGMRLRVSSSCLHQTDIYKRLLKNISA